MAMVPVPQPVMMMEVVLPSEQVPVHVPEVAQLQVVAQVTLLGA